NLDKFPRRLLDVESYKSSGRVKVVPTDRIIDKETLRYIYLSHCWGKAADLPVATRHNLSQRYEPWSELSKTIRDAVKITRGLGLRYIWVDSLCIV
ncbi:hypothetical protein B0T25DRAFT_457220, partial [Lasiosphaeria hispida]